MPYLKIISRDAIEGELEKETTTSWKENSDMIADDFCMKHMNQSCQQLMVTKQTTISIKSKCLQIKIKNFIGAGI